MAREDALRPEGVGQRLKTERKLAGITQQQLARKMRYSLGMVRQVEQETALASSDFVQAAARALGTTVDVLYGQPFNELVGDDGRSAIPELRRALIEFDDGVELVEHRTLADLKAQLAKVTKLYLRTRYDDVTVLLPDLLRHLFTAADSVPSGHDRERAHGLLAEAYGKALATAYKLGYLDLAAIAAERGRWAAERSNDPLLMTMADYHRAVILLYSGAYSTGLRVVGRAYDRTDHLPDGPALFTVRGSLHLRSALLAARANDLDTANTYLDEARTCARLLRDLPPFDPYNTSFNDDDVAIHSVSIPLELADATTAVERASQITLSRAVKPSRIGHHEIDTARAYLLNGDRQASLDALNRARRVAAGLTRSHPQVRETVITLAEQETRRSDSLAGFARWAGIRL